MPVNVMLIRALLNFYAYYGDDFKIECPTGSGREMTLYQVAEEVTRRLAGTFLKDSKGRRSSWFARNLAARSARMFAATFHQAW